MLEFDIISDMTPLGSYRQILCQSRFTAMLKLSVAIILLCKISLDIFHFIRRSNRVINFFNSRNFNISTQKKLFREFQILRNPQRETFRLYL